MVMARLGELLSEFGVRLYPRGKRLVGRCPIHGGRDPNSFNMYARGGNPIGNWKCRSHECNQAFRSSIIGFTRGVISHEKYGWESLESPHKASHREAVDFLLNFLNITIEDVKPDYARMSRQRYIADTAIFTRRVEKPNEICTREEIRRLLDIPAQYFLDRGYSSSVLDAYDVGYCDRRRSSMYGRVVIPIYNHADRKSVVGTIGRSVFEKCDDCRMHHDHNLPCPKSPSAKYAKWMATKGFVDKNHLYNLWNSWDYIKQMKSIVFVEGPGDVWRLEEAGIYNSVAVLGSEFTRQQKILLEAIKPKTFFVLTDNDDAGEKVAEDIKRLIRHWGEFVRLYPDGHDVGEMSIEDVASNFRSTIVSAG
jgi:5S rRNA maturation endonuclease (ribonuclease M5)